MTDGYVTLPFRRPPRKMVQVGPFGDRPGKEVFRKETPSL